MKLKNWRQSGNYFDYKSLPIFYCQSRSADEVLLLLHGFPTSSHDYHKVWDALTEKFAVLTFDMIGYGSSAKPSSFDYTTFNQVDVLQSLIEKLNIKKVHILAHDYGNTITQELLARATEKRLDFTIETICMMNGALFPETHRPILAQKLLLSPIGFLFGRLISDDKFKKSLASVFGKHTQPTDEEMNEFIEAFKFNDGQKIANKLIRYMREREKYRARWVGALEQMEQPFRLINGLTDRVSGAHLVKRFRQVVPHQTDIIELADIGHFPHFEVAEIVLDKFFEFHCQNRLR